MCFVCLVTRQEGITLAKNLGMRHFETSAVTGLNVEATFTWVVKAVSRTHSSREHQACEALLTLNRALFFQTAIRMATMQADIGAVEALIHLKVPNVDQKWDGQILANAIIQVPGDEGFTPLHYASLYGATQLLSLLLVQKGIVVDARDALGEGK